MVRTFSDYLVFLLQNIPIVILGWIHLAKSGFLFIYTFWDKKALFDKVFFIFLFFQFILCNFSWFSYQITFFDTPEIVSISPKWNFFFILVSLLNFFFLGFWKSSWIRIWFFSTQMIMLILLLWGYLEPTRFFFDFINTKEIQFRPVFYFFATTTVLTFISGYFSFQDEDRRFEIV